MSELTDIDRAKWRIQFKNQKEIEQESYVVCPHCFAEEELGLYEFSRWGLEAEWFGTEYKCGHCGKVYYVEGKIEYKTWGKTKKLEE